MNVARQQIQRGVIWFSASSVAVRVLDAMGTLIVVRVLTQVEFGTAALAAAVTALVESLSGLGVGTALIKQEKTDRSTLSTLFWFCVGSSLLVGAAVACAGPWLADLYAEQALFPLLLIPALKVVVVAAALIPHQLLVRSLRFKEAAGIQAGAMGVEAISKVALALAGFGAWALVLAELLRALAVLAGAFGLTRFKPALHFRLSEVRWFLSFGWRTSLSTLVTEAYKNLDYFLIGRWLGMSALGVYRLAFYIAVTTADAVAQPVYRVTYPVFARLEDREKLVRSFLDSSRYLLTMLAPIAVFLFFAGDTLVGVVAADGWLGAVPAVQILCFAGLLRAMTRLFDNFFFALSRPTLALLDAVLSLSFLGALLPVLLQLFGRSLGIQAAGYAWLLSYPAVFVVLFWVAAGLAPLRLVDYARELSPVLLAAAVMALSLLAFEVLSHSLGGWVRLVIAAALGLMSYGLALLSFGARRLGDLR